MNKDTFTLGGKEFTSRFIFLVCAHFILQHIMPANRFSQAMHANLQHNATSHSKCKTTQSSQLIYSNNAAAKLSPPAVCKRASRHHGDAARVFMGTKS